jgi:hypothetical protein
MAALVQALDNFTPIRIGEKGHIELAWSNDLQEKIVQFDFQCVRTDANGINSLSLVLNDLLSQLWAKRDSDEDENKRKELLVVLYKIIGKTRDIEDGKGEYAISYMMIWTWFEYFPKMAELALALFVLPPTGLNRFGFNFEGSDVIPYGSWKDMKYFCDYIRNESGTAGHPLIDVCIEYTNTQLRADDLAYQASTKDLKLSLVSKWIPREKSRFGWLHSKLACAYFPEYMSTAGPPATCSVTYQRAEKKCVTQYRILCAKLNRHLDTVQIKQTSGDWASIDHSKTTSITMAKQRKAFLNQNIKGSEPRTDKPDRIQCAENLRAYMESLKKNGKEVKGKNIGLDMFAQHARNLMSRYYFPNPNQEEIDILNSQWRDNCAKKNANGLGPMIAMIDMSGSMEGDPMNAAISLGCRVAEKSCLGKRVMTFSSEPAWLNLDGCANFTDMVKMIVDSGRIAGTSTDFYKALNMILHVIEERRIPAEDVENMVLAIFSDMQIDANLSMAEFGGYNCSEEQKVTARRRWITMHNLIKAEYAELGVRLYGKPLNAPHILFWNLRKTDGFPTLSTELGCSMMSGFDPTILNMFCEMGMEALREMTPYNMLFKLLSNKRYDPLESIARASFV